MTRARSFWAWGWADKLPNDDARRALASRLGALFGRDFALQPLPSADSVSLPPPRVRSELPCATNDRDARLSHTHGKGFPDLVRALRGDFTRAPDVVAYPKDERDVGAVLAWCADARVAAIPYGGGTSVVGGVECDVGAQYAGTCTIDLRAMDRVLEVDATSRAARIQAGALGPHIEEQLAPHGVSLRHFPQSFEFSTLGGWIATRAGGHFATLYTHIDDLVESVRMVTGAGTIATRRLPASGAGPKPEALVLGSEGALGVITEAWVRVHPRPQWRASASLHFASFEEAVACARSLAQSGLYPTNCRALDPTEAMIHGAAMDGTAVLLVAFESADHPLDAWMERALAIGSAHGGACPKGARFKAEGEKVGGGDAASDWRAAFFDAPYRQSALLTLGVIADTFETACTWDRFDALHAAITRAAHDAMMRATGVTGVLSCRFTHVYPDGPAPYYTFLAPARVGDEIAQWAVIKEAVSEAIVANGGTITHHHAVGRRHGHAWTETAGGMREADPLFLRALARVKDELDPAHVLNPGVLLPSRGELGPGHARERTNEAK